MWNLLETTLVIKSKNGRSSQKTGVTFILGVIRDK